MNATTPSGYPEIDQRDVFLMGKHVILKVLTREDVLHSNWYGWFNDEEVCKTLQKHYYPNSREAQMDFWERNVAKATNKIQLGICRATGGPLVGIISLNNIDLINRKAEMSVIIGEKTERNINFFLESCRLLFTHAFDALGLNRIYGGSISKELVQLMCRMLGCQVEGIARKEIYKHGQFHDSHLYGLLRDEFIRK